MPRYDYHCSKCDIVKEYIHKMSENPEISCPDCGRTMKKLIGNIGGFTIKGGTETIHWREKRNRIKRSAEMKKRQRDHYGPGPKIQPNIAGVPVDSWSDAQKMAKEAGMNHESYTSWVKKEDKKKVKGKVITADSQ